MGNLDLVFGIILILLVSCRNYFREGGVNVPGVKSDFELQVLFEIEGCKMFRFYDPGIVSAAFSDTHPIYWAKCNREDTVINKYDKYFGKDCVVTIRNEVPTIYKD